MCLVTHDVPSDFLDPIIAVRAAAELVLARLPVAAMPEVPIAEDYQPVTPEDDVWLTRQFADVLPVTKAPVP
jgi:hypothetical protein